MPRTSLKRALEELETAGLVTAHERRDKLGRNKSNQYELHMHGHSFEVEDRKDEGAILDHSGVHSGPREGAILDPEPVIDNLRLTTSINDGAARILSSIIDDGHAFWDEAVGALLTFGIVESTARTFTGRCLKWAKGDQKRVMQAYEAALAKNPRDPIAYISKILTSKQGGLEQKRMDYEAAFAAIDLNSDNFSKAWMYDSEADKSTGVSAKDSGLLQSDPFAEPEPVYASPVGSSDGVRAESSTGSQRPKNGYLGEMQIPSLNSGSR